MTRHGYMSASAAYSDRKTNLLKHRPACMQCRANVNVTLTDSYVSPARWWCARCKHDFVYEPMRER